MSTTQPDTGARPTEAARPAPRPRSPCRRSAPSAAALGLAAADQHAHRAAAAAAARRGGRPRVGVPAARINPARVEQYLAEHPGSGRARPARVLRRLLLGLVLRHLPAALRVAGRLRRCPGARVHLQAAAGRAAAHARAAWSGSRRTRRGGRRRPADEVLDARGARTLRRAATGWPGTTTQRLRRARLPRRDRQPGLPPGPARPARRGRRRLLLGYCGQVLVVEGTSFSNAFPTTTASTAGPRVDQGEPGAVHPHARRDAGALRGPGRRQPVRRARGSSTPTSPSATEPGAAAAQSRSAERPAGLGRRPRVPRRQRLRPGDHRARRDRRVAFSGPVPFLPPGDNYKSLGVVKVPYAHAAADRRSSGFFLPTVAIDPGRAPSRCSPTPSCPGSR